MPCPLPLASRKTHRTKAKQPAPSSHRTSVREGIHPLRRRIAPIPHHLCSLIRASCFARKRAFNPNNASCSSARYRLLVLRHEGGAASFVALDSVQLAQHSPRNISSLRAATAARNCTSYRRPPAGALSPYDCTSHLAFKTGSKPTACAASSAQHALRALARLQPNPRELHFSSLPIAPIHPRNTSSLRAATAARKRAVQPDQRELQFSSLPLACSEPQSTQPYSSLAALYRLRSVIRAKRLCVPLPPTDRTGRETSLTPAVASPIVSHKTECEIENPPPNGWISDSEVPDAARPYDADVGGTTGNQGRGTAHFGARSVPLPVLRIGRDGQLRERASHVGGFRDAAGSQREEG